MKYKVTAMCMVQVVTIVEATSEKDAIDEASDRDVNICIHGSELAEHEIDEVDLCLVDGCNEGLSQFEAEEYE